MYAFNAHKIARIVNMNYLYLLAKLVMRVLQILAHLAFLAYRDTTIMKHQIHFLVINVQLVV